MRRAGFAVWLAPSLGGSYEEGPPTLIDSLKRDRRWCQGNLQHFWLLFSPAWKGISRMNLAGGVLNYLSSPIWLTFLLLSSFIARDTDIARGIREPVPILESVAPAKEKEIPAPANPHSGEPAGEDPASAAAKIRELKGFWKNLGADFREFYRDLRDAPKYVLFLITLVMLFGIKGAVVLSTLADKERVAGFGGRSSFLVSILLETLFFFILAPILMIFHSRFVVMTLLGQGVRWVTQRRAIGEGLDWREPILTFGWETLIFGFGWGAITWFVAPSFFWWLLPVLLGIVLSVPFAIITSLKMAEEPGAKTGLFRTPDLVDEPPVLANLRDHLAKAGSRLEPHPRLQSDYGFMLVVLDPYVNALHCSLLRQRKSAPPESKKYYAAVAERVLAEGPAAVKREDKLALLYDTESLTRLHRTIWSSPAARIAPWWQFAISQYNVAGREPIRQLYR